MFNIFRFAGVALLFFVNLLTVHAREESGFSGFNADIFGLSIAKAEVTARVAVWNPEDRTGYIAVRFKFPDEFYQIDDEKYFTLEPVDSNGVVYGSVLKPKPFAGQDGIAKYIDPTTLLLEFSVDSDSMLFDISIMAHYQLCDSSGTCLPPDNERLVVQINTDNPTIEMNESVREILRWNEKPDGVQELSLRKMLLYLLMALTGGILLNFLPCILPLLSIKALGLVKQAGADRRAILTNAWLYVFGIEVSFWILAAVVISVKASGNLLGWGFQFQSPIFLLLLISIIWVLALSLFDVFVIEAPKKGLNMDARSRNTGGYTGSFLTGIFAVVIAAPCMAPLLGTAMGFAFFQPPMVILTFFSVTGIGFGLPFLLLGYRPEIIKKFPKPGAWMISFKEIMGFILLATAVYLFIVFTKLAPDAVGNALWWLLVLSLSAWLFGKARQPSSRPVFRIAGQAVVVLIIFITGSIFYMRSYVREQTTIEFEESDFQTRIDAGETVFLEYSAEWCMICKLNQRVLNNRKVKKLMAEKNITHIRADLTSYNKILLRRLAEIGKAGVPQYVLYVRGMEPYIFPSLITVNKMTDIFMGL